MDWTSLLAGLGGGIQGGNAAMIAQQQRDYEGQQQDIENERQKQYLALALSNGELARRAANREDQQLVLQQQQLAAQQQQAQQAKQEAAFKDALLFAGGPQRYTPEQMAGMGAGPGTARAALFQPHGNPSDLAGRSLSGAIIAPTAVSGSTRAPGASLPGASAIDQTDNSPGSSLPETFQDQMKRKQLDQAAVFQQMKDARDQANRESRETIADNRLQAMLGIAAANAGRKDSAADFANEQKLKTGYEASNKLPADAVMAYARMKEVAPLLLDPNTPLANRAAAEAAIFEGNQKIVNPGVAVRASQAKLYTDHQSIAQNFQALLQKWTRGGQLAPATVQAFMDSADKTAKPALTAYGANRDRFRTYAHKHGLDEEFILGPDLRDSFQNSTTASPAATSAAPSAMDTYLNLVGGKKGS